MLNLLSILTLFGGIYAVTVLYRIADFVWIYLLRPSSIRNYLTTPASYALVTGASDGIGKALSKQLYLEGFNLILHGKNREKMEKTIAEIRASKPQSNKDIRIFLADAAQPEHDFKKMVEPFKHLNITMVFNNVGGGTPRLNRIDACSTKEGLDMINMNAIFPLHLIQTLLPQLRQSPGPVLVIQTGSLSGNLPPLRAAIYAASKSFLEQLSLGLSVDERYFTPTNVDFMYLMVGRVSTKIVGSEPASLLCPDTDTFAKSVVNKIGCGRQKIIPYAPHAILYWLLRSLPGNVVIRILAKPLKELTERLDDTRLKKDN